jgi:E3 ubiquitin-protein ligase SH3RF
MTYAKSKSPAPQSYNPRTLPPPELPPRAISPSSTTVSSSWHAGGQQNQGLSQETSPPRHNDQNATTNPLGRSHSAVMTSNIRMYFEYYMLKNIFQYHIFNIISVIIFSFF